MGKISSKELINVYVVFENDLVISNISNHHIVDDNEA